MTSAWREDVQPPPTPLYPRGHTDTHTLCVLGQGASLVDNEGIVVYPVLINIYSRWSIIEPCLFTVPQTTLTECPPTVERVFNFYCVNTLFCCTVLYSVSLPNIPVNYCFRCLVFSATQRSVCMYCGVLVLLLICTIVSYHCQCFPPRSPSARSARLFMESCSCVLFSSCK